MSAVVVYESVYGNTRAVAEAIAAGLGGAEVLPVHEATGRAEDAELLVAGGPTHVHGMTTTRSRQSAVEGAREDGGAHVESGAAEEPGLRAWIRDLPASKGGAAAAFDTRADKAPWLPGPRPAGSRSGFVDAAIKSSERRASWSRTRRVRWQRENWTGHGLGGPSLPSH